MIRKEPLDGGRFVYVDDTCTFGADAVLLARFAPVRDHDRVCDLGCGSGIIPLIWFADGISPTVDAVDLSLPAVQLAQRTVEENALSTHITVHHQDWTALTLPTDAYDLVTCNPPYFAAGSGKTSQHPLRRLARHETSTTLSDVCAAAYRLLKVGGHCCLCHRPERLPDLLEQLRRAHLEPKRLQVVYAHATAAPFLILCDAVKGGAPSLSVLPPHFLESR